MFAPNVWSFDSPNTHIVYKYSESNEKHEKQICKRIHSHPFNRVVRKNNFSSLPIENVVILNRILVQCIVFFFVYIEIASTT